jgi:hypothetical protein
VLNIHAAGAPWQLMLAVLILPAASPLMLILQNV